MSPDSIFYYKGHIMTNIDGLNPDFQSFLKEVLRTNPEGINIIFKKKDGTERKMLSTLVESNIPTEFKPKGEDTVVTNDVLRVFDLENQGWRSFRWDSVINISYTLRG